METDVREILPAPNPWGDGRRAFKRGDDCWEAAALQLNLNAFGNRLVLDGVIGPATEKVIRAFQTHRGLTADGIAGAVTQEWIVRNLSAGAERDEQLPAGLLRGLAEHESSFLLSAYSPHPDGEGFDLGAYQDAYETVGSQDSYRESLDVGHMAARTAAEIRERHDRYRAGGATYGLAWECAVLGHNWPVAADRMAKGRDPVPNADTAAGWVEQASGGRLHTPREWALDYIAQTTRYVRW